MKYLLLLLLVWATFTAMAGNDKGNVGGVTYVNSSQDLLLQYGLDLHEVTYATLQGKKIVLSSGEVTVLGLEILTFANGKFRPEVAPLLVLIKELLKRNEVELLKSITTGSEEFYDSFSTRGLEEEILVLNLSQEEKIRSLTNIRKVTKGFWTAAKNEVVRDLGLSKWAEFARSADTKKLGYEL